MILDWPQAPHEETERRLFRFVLWIVGCQLLGLLLGTYRQSQKWADSLEALGVILTAAMLFALALWAVVFVLRRLPHDSALLPGVPESYEEPVEWAAVLNQIPNIQALEFDDRRRLDRMVAYFIQHVHFEGCNGLEITDRVRVTIAAQACLLALNLPRGSLGRLKEVLVYPTAFVPKRETWSPTAPESEPHAALGESWHQGTVILAWDDVVHGVEVPNDGHNVALHEFAHQLDSAGGQADGTPPLGSAQRYAAWSRVLEESFARFSKETEEGHDSAMDGYGTTNQAEFFAVATETFFERPAELKQQYPELYEQLRTYYRQG